MTQHLRSNSTIGAIRVRHVPAQPAQQPRTVGDWELVEQIAVGDLTSTFTARPVGSDKPCQYIAKVVSGDAENREVAIRLLVREAVVGRKVCHAHLISVLDAHIHQPPYYLVTPRLPGTTLQEILGSQTRLELPVALWVARQVGEALGALHREQWLHGDIKPANILIAPDGHATLLDLGFARQFDEAGSAVDRLVLGTFNYIAPETVTSKLAADVRSDVYSLGVVLYQSLAGRLPFEGRTLAELARQHRQARPTCIRSIVPDLLKPVATLVHSMLSKQPLRRPQTANEVVRELTALEIDTFSQRRSA